MNKKMTLALAIGLGLSMAASVTTANSRQCVNFCVVKGNSDGFSGTEAQRRAWINRCIDECAEPQP